LVLTEERLLILIGAMIIAMRATRMLMTGIGRSWYRGSRHAL